MGTGCSIAQNLQAARVLMIGLDGSGKTSLLYSYILKLGEVMTTIPTVGFNVETIRAPVHIITVTDVGGQEKIRPLWRHYTSGTNGIVYVVDSTDASRLAESRHELHGLLRDEHKHLDGVPLVVLANKQDVKGALTPEQVADSLDLDLLKEKHQLCVIGTDFQNRAELKKAFSKLSQMMYQKNR